MISTPNPLVLWDCAMPKMRAIVRAAQKADVVMMSKDSDFLNLLDGYGPPPKVIWVTCGNTSNQRT